MTGSESEIAELETIEPAYVQRRWIVEYLLSHQAEFPAKNSLRLNCVKDLYYKDRNTTLERTLGLKDCVDAVTDVMVDLGLW